MQVEVPNRILCIFTGAQENEAGTLLCKLTFRTDFPKKSVWSQYCRRTSHDVSTNIREPTLLSSGDSRVRQSLDALPSWVSRIRRFMAVSDRSAGASRISGLGAGPQRIWRHDTTDRH